MTGIGSHRVGIGRSGTLSSIAAAAVALALAACGSGSTTASAPSVAPTATIAVTAPPATQAGPKEPCDPGCQMFAGQYHASKFDGGITFTLIGEVWTSVAYEPEILSVQIGDAWVVFMSGALRIASGDSFEMSSDVVKTQALLAKLPGITVKPAEPVTIDGQKAVVFDVANTGTGTVQLWGLGQTSGRYMLDPATSVRMHWVDRSGVPFVLALEESTRSFASFLGDSQPIIAGVAFD
jgi:hypothetical protein